MKRKAPPTFPEIDIEKVNQFNFRLLNWYSQHGRQFPWRRYKDFYPVLVAEILLQKTNAAKVVDVFNHILALYPSIDELSTGSVDQLKQIIAPIGLFKKANILINAAQELKSLSNKSLETSDLLKIKGVGLYMARAVLIHSKNSRLSLLDPNFIRIYERVFGIKSNLRRPRTDQILWEVAEKLLPIANISDYTYAILDFGALKCILMNPVCINCPMFGDICGGFSQ